MERSEIMSAMGELKLYGMKSAFDEIIATAVKRQHEPQRIVGDLLTAEISEKQARSIKYQIAIARLPMAKEIDEFVFDGTPINETLVRDLAGGGFLAQQRNLVLIGGTGTGKTHIAVGIARACIRGGARGRFFNVVDLVNKLEAEARAGRQGRLADHLCRMDLVVLDELTYTIQYGYLDADLIVRDLGGQDIVARAAIDDSLFRSLTEMWLAIYQDHYRLMGSPAVMSAKVIWDIAFYWGFIGLFYSNDRFTSVADEPEVVPHLHGLIELSNRMQKFFLEWADIRDDERDAERALRVRHRHDRPRRRGGPRHHIHDPPRVAHVRRQRAHL